MCKTEIRKLISYDFLFLWLFGVDLTMKLSAFEINCGTSDLFRCMQSSVNNDLKRSIIIYINFYSKAYIYYSVDETSITH